MYICMYVCVYVCIYVCMYVCICVYILYIPVYVIQIKKGEMLPLIRNIVNQSILHVTSCQVNIVSLFYE